MSVQTNKAAYRRHAYSGPRKSLKKVRGGLRKHHGGEESRLKAWRSGAAKKKPVKEETGKEKYFAQNTLKTYAHVKSETCLRTTNSVPSTLVVEPFESSEIPDSFQFVNWCEFKVKSQGKEVKIEPFESLPGYSELDIPASPDTKSDEQEIPDKQPQPVSISLDTHKRAADTSSRCIFKNCRYSDRLVPSRSVKERLLIDYSFYLPSNARVCSQHQINSHKEWSELVRNSSITDFTAAHLEDLLSILKDTIGNKYCRNFDMLIKQDDILCQYLMGIEYKKYEELIKDIEPIRKQVRNLKNALAMYLMKKHTGFSDEKVANFFGVGVKLLVNSVDKVHAHFESVVATDESYENLPTLGVDENGEIVYYMICE